MHNTNQMLLVDVSGAYKFYSNFAATGRLDFLTFTQKIYEFNVTMYWQKELEFCMILLITKFVNGVRVKTQFTKIFGEGEANIARFSVAGRSDDYLAVAMDESNECTNLDWTWGSTPTYKTGSTYYEKKQVVQIYETPLVLGGGMKLPITFRAGSYISMHLEFASDNFDVCSIRLMDMFEETFSVYDAVPEVVLANMLLHPTGVPSDVIFKSYRWGWRNHGSFPFSFAARPSPYNITIKALTNDMQILFDGNVSTQYTHRTAPEDARQLLFPYNAGLLLHKIEFVGV